MACLDWLLNLDFAGSSAAEPLFIGIANVTITSYLLPILRLNDSLYPIHEVKGQLSEVTLQAMLSNAITLRG